MYKVWSDWPNPIEHALFHARCLLLIVGLTLCDEEALDLRKKERKKALRYNRNWFINFG